MAVLVSSSRAAPRTETVAASRPFGSIRAILETWRSMASAQPSSTPGQDRFTRETVSVRPSSMSGPTAGNETLLLPSCTVARRTRGRPIGGSIGRCQALSIPHFSNTSSLTSISSAEKHASLSPTCSNPPPVRSEALLRGLNIASASTSRMGLSSTSQRLGVVPPRRWPQSPSTSRTRTFISLLCASQAREWSTHDRIQPCPQSDTLKFNYLINMTSPVTKEADPLHSELRILDWIFYQVCINEIKKLVFLDC
jgi:hypothetical protein